MGIVNLSQHPTCARQPRVPAGRLRGQSVVIRHHLDQRRWKSNFADRQFQKTSNKSLHGASLSHSLLDQHGCHVRVKATVQCGAVKSLAALRRAEDALGLPGSA